MLKEGTQSKNQDDINDIFAATAVGKAEIMDKEKEELWSKLLLDKHSYLKDFIEAPTTAIVKIEVSKYYFVSSFQEVIEWAPLPK